MTSGPDRRPAYVRYRAIAAKLDGGSIALFPAPHTYIAPRDYTTNMGYVWFHGWAGRAAPGAPGVLGNRDTPAHRRRRGRILSVDQCAAGHSPAAGRLLFGSDGTPESALQPGEPAICFHCDGAVCDDSDPAAVARVVGGMDRVDILVNNAGVTWGQPAEEMPLDRW